MEKALIFKAFKEEDFKQYKSWFDHDRMRKSLENIDEEWLDYILTDRSGIEYSIFSGNELISVLGLSLPCNQEPYYAITNIAINPKYFREGIGSKVLKQLYLVHPLKQSESWLAFVDQENLSAQSFFEKNGWRFIRLEEENLKRYEYSYL